jgi:MoaA/NifB/PqqE/SkfB family radical SAM enzyme
MVGPGEIARRARGRMTGRLETLPILAMSVHSACNCRCVMCDIWKANAEKREISSDDLSRHIEAIRALRVQRVMLTGGEPLLHRNLWALCAQLQPLDIRITLVTTGLLLENHAPDVAACIDTVVVSLDGPRAVHDRIRRVNGGFDRVAKGLVALHAQASTPRLIARSVVQRENAGAISETIAAARHLGFDEISFLAADVSSTAFNRPSPWPESRAREIALDAHDIVALESAIDRAVTRHRKLFDSGFIAGGHASLDRIAQYFRAILGPSQFPKVHCNAPWVSAVLEPGGTLRPCFFQEEYGSASEHLEHALNGDRAVDFRRRLNVAGNGTCRRCVCSLNLPLTARA